MKVADVGLKEVYCATPMSTLNEIATMMKRHGVGSIPVCEGDHLVGIVTDRDIVLSCVAAGTNPASCMVNEIMTSEPIGVNPRVDLEDAAGIMAREQIRRLPVMEGDSLVGMISLADMARALPDNDRVIADTLRGVSAPI
jgi:CBS domain-containing protein